MDFSRKTLGGQRTRYYESDTESSLQLVFLPGVYCPEMWKHQVKYFSESFRTITYRPDRRDYDSQMKMMEDILEQDGVDNVVLVSQGLGNRLARELEYREEVVATILTGARTRGPRIPRQLFSLS
ncbi:MAG: alpha/beta fold hydrolase, partial [Candidatus Nanohaloarchaea archaeon]